jgi:hypothetical protein
MGFGYLLVGYLLAFLLYIPINGFGFGGLALILGSAVMLMGLWELNRFHSAFVFAKWLQIPLLLAGVYDFFASLDNMLLWSLPLFGETAKGVADWISFMLAILFNLAMLYGIRAIAKQVGLLHMVAVAVRNSFFVAFYAALYLIARLPLPESYLRTMAMPLMLLNLVWVICNSVLLLSCNKNICRAGDEDQPAKPSRFAIVNRISETYEKNRQRAIDTTRQEIEDRRRRREESRNSKKKKK